MDNPCLSRGLIADFTNSRCYKQTSTIVTNFAKWWYISGWIENSLYYSNGIKCYDINDGYNEYYIGQAVGAYTCKLFNTSYSCPATYPYQVNNSICEYREAF